MAIVAVGSLNPAKIKAVESAFKRMWPEKQWEVVGFAANSKVSNQPTSDRESIRGATNRAKQSLKAFKADFGVGLEGGLHKIGKKWFETGWSVVVDKQGNRGVGSSIRMEIPDSIYKKISEGLELGEVIDIVFERKNLKQAEGYFGIMTRNNISRSQGYSDGLLAALVSFEHPDLFKK